MRPLLLPLLALADLALAALLGWMWFTPQGQPRGLHWTPPAAVQPALGDAPALPEPGPGAGQFVATLERPLFAPTRRPPPPPQAAASAPPVVVDPAPDVRLLGLYGVRATEPSGAASAASGADTGHPAPAAGGMVARIDGQIRRVRVGAAVSGSWMLKAVRPGEAVIARGDEERVFALRRLGVDEAPLASADNAGSGAQGAARVPGANPVMHREVELARERVRRLNALRARAGIPLLPEP